MRKYILKKFELTVTISMHIFRLVLKFPVTGGIIPSYAFRTSKLLRYVTQIDYCILAAEIVFVMFIIYFTFEEAIEVI